MIEVYKSRVARSRVPALYARDASRRAEQSGAVPYRMLGPGSSHVAEDAILFSFSFFIRL
jgi:hypothetical protein